MKKNDNTKYKKFRRNKRASLKTIDYFVTFWNTRKRMLGLPKEKKSTHHILIVEYR